MSTEGPFLYDDDPAPLHTGTPRRRQGLLLWLFGGTALVAVLMVVAMPLVKGSPEEQAREVTGVFLAALAKGDNETAFQLLCEEERAQVPPDGVAGRYLTGEGAGKVVSSRAADVDGSPVQQVRVEWPDGSATRLTVVNSDGPHVCGVTAGG
jgi:hypothetical protein